MSRDLDRLLRPDFGMRRGSWSEMSRPVRIDPALYHEREAKTEEEITHMHADRGRVRTVERAPRRDRPAIEPGMRRRRTAPRYGERTCLKCGSAFEVTTPNRLFCSPACRDAYRTELRVCAACGKEYTSFRPSQRYCSKRCAKSLVRVRHRRSCAVCGRVFQPWKTTQVCCSRKCGAVYRQRSHDAA